MLQEAGLKRSEIFLTNVLHIRPPNNKIEDWCVPKKDLPSDYTLPPLSNGKYLRPEFAIPELERLADELSRVRPNLVLALGNTACWALLGTTAISKLRGTVAPCKLVPGLKVLPTYHPAGVLRNWEWRPLVVADLLKAAYERTFPEIKRPVRYVNYDPDIGDLFRWKEELLNANTLAVDTETKMGQITCVGFAPNSTTSFVVPFVDLRKADGNYWATAAEEFEAWSLVATVMASPSVKIFQNGLYDIQYFLRHKIPLRNCIEDTMILHHALYPELQKGLGFMGSIYTSEPAWKLMRHKSEELKRDE